MAKPIYVETNKRSYCVLPANPGEPLAKVEWLPGEKVVEISIMDNATETE